MSDAVPVTARDDLDLAGVVSAVLGLSVTTDLVPALDAAGWRRVLDVAVRERCAPLCWLRNGATIRDLAPPDVVTAWRSHAVAAELRARRHLQVLERCVAALSDAGVAVVCLKGAGLAQRLYGVLLARPCDDIDIYVAAGSRPAARAALARVGCRHLSGREPWDEEFAHADGDGEILVEVHSSLVCDNLGHLDVPEPETRAMDVAGVRLPVMDGDFLPAYLAAHLAQHEMPPLLWFVDFFELWRGLDPSARERAVAAARRARVGRCLDWAVERATAVAGAIAGDRGSVGTLGFTDQGRRDVAPLARLFRLAESRSDAGHLAMMWLWPRTLRTRPIAFLNMWLERLRRPTVRRLLPSRRYES